MKVYKVQHSALKYSTAQAQYSKKIRIKAHIKHFKKNSFYLLSQSSISICLGPLHKSLKQWFLGHSPPLLGLDALSGGGVVSD